MSQVFTPSNDPARLARPDLLRRLNERRVLDTFRTVGACSRADITRQTGISAPTVSRLVASLLETGVLEECEAEESRIGRPSKQLRLALGKVQVVGAMLGVEQTKLFAAGLDGTLDPASSQSFPTPSRYEDILQTIADQVQQLRGRTAQTLGVGISVPGLLDEAEGRVLFSPNLHQTDGKYLAKDLAGLMDLDVTAIQESRALCLAERLHGGARDLRDYLILDVCEGVGVGIVMDGRIIVGRKGLAGEFGHMTIDPDGPLCGCGNRGCLESLTSNRAIVEQAGKIMGRPMSLQETVSLAHGGNAKIRALFDSTLPWMAIGLATLINGFNPEAVFVHSYLAHLGSDVLEHLTDLTRQRALAASMKECRILWSKGSKEQGAVAAAIDRLVAGHGPLLGDA